MKKFILMFAVAVAAIACEKNTSEVKQYKTAYVDTNKLLEEYTGAKDIDAKYKAKSEEMGKQLQAEVAKFKAEAGSFQRDAQANGQAWAQKKGAELQKREQQLTYAQQAMLQQLQQESGVEMDTLIKTMKKFLKDYGKEKGYDYIYGTGEAASILYAKDQYDITEEVIKLLNEQYKSQGKKEETAKPATESK
ncbi:MAG: OmpH family outer membrane protein [Flavobacterium sp.]|nr:MAG: OmpH family outer membrane protein [Flavobacterium sp.]